MGLFRRYGPVPFDITRSPMDLIFETLRIYIGQKTELTMTSRLHEDLGICGDDREEMFKFLGSTFEKSFSVEDCLAVRTVADLMSLCVRGEGKA